LALLDRAVATVDRGGNMGIFSKIPESVAFPVLVYGGIGLVIALILGMVFILWR